MKWPHSARKATDKVFGNTQNTALSVQLEEMANARYGVTYMLAKTEMVKEASFSLDLVGTFGVDTTAATDLKNGCKYLLNKTDAGAKIVGGLSAVGDKIGEVKDKIKEIIAGFFRSFIDKIKDRYAHVVSGMEWLTEFGAWAISEFAGNLSSLIPGWGYVQAAADIYAGVRQAVLKAKDFVTQLWSGRGVKLLGGHPSIIASALARHSAAGFAGGIKDAALGITSLGLEAAGDAAGGAGTIVAAVTGILQRIANLVDYVIQFTRMKSIRKTAEGMWKKEALRHAAKQAQLAAKAAKPAKAAKAKKDAEDAKARWLIAQREQSLMDDHKAFSQWFQKATIANPIVAALTMGSGFVAHPLRFMQLLKPDGRMADDEEFAKGVHHIETLKKLSSKYIDEYTDNYGVVFQSADNFVQARLTELQTGKGILTGTHFQGKQMATP